MYIYIISCNIKICLNIETYGYMEENIPKCSYFCISVGVQVILIEITLE